MSEPSSAMPEPSSASRAEAGPSPRARPCASHPWRASASPGSFPTEAPLTPTHGSRQTPPNTIARHPSSPNVRQFRAQQGMVADL
eukprot:3004371-Rhodomonas_salina.2